MRIVVDTSSLFYGFQPDGKSEYITTNSVLEEIKNNPMKKSLSMMLEFLKVLQPSPSTVNIVEESAKHSGDLDQLSKTDLELIALAKEQEGLLLTNDLSIQNVCLRLGIKYQSFAGKSIDTEIEWGYKCVGCHRRFNRMYEECPHCGNKLKKYPKKRKPITGST